MSASAVRLRHAERLLNGRLEVSGVWPRCCAWLLRLALENALRELWGQRRPELSACSRRAQLLALQMFTGMDTARATAELWYALSRVAHHHDYDLSPTAAELRDWHYRAREVCAALNP
ncbi:hypothetical protein [Saccharopolyspora gloriosae]|uniref:hypothetical protein n=1 Tax=Saccharopolyspora gloriosae TaxID=455344 RepID=UPI001FB709E5|nr:hypothetical protein [Saccharopolyspora gloriosae]